MTQLLPKKTLIALVALSALFSAACVKQDAPGVGVVKFDSSAIFGITPNEKPVLPDFEVPDLSSEDLPDLDFKERVLPPVDPGPCPEALLTAFPKKSSTPQVIGLPTAGVYKWQRDLLTLKDTSADPPVKTFPFALEGRAIRRVVQEGDHQFTFEMLAPDPFVASDTVITSFKVNTNPVLFVDRRVDSRTIGVVNIPGTDVRVANPSDAPGVFITGIDVQNSAGTRVSAFRPVQPMLILPLEGGIVRTGQQFRSVGIDAATGTAVMNDGVTGRTSRVDACGEIVEGYVVTLHQVLSSDVDPADPVGAGGGLAFNQETREITYTFATQYGALPIAESLSIGDINVDEVAALGKWELGALTPTALPDSLK
jgi:hypothetical protein